MASSSVDPPCQARAAEPESMPEVPYGIDQRRMPDGTEIVTLLPDQVGQFVREPLEPLATPLTPVYATYRRGRADVFVELGVGHSAADAQQALANAKAETDAEFGDEPQVYGQRDDIGFLRTVNRLGAFMAWTRGKYYFSAHARRGEEDLDEFMAAFPY